MLNFFRSIAIYIDVGVFWVVEKLLQLIFDLSNVEVFSNSVIEEFSNRIYIILGLLMVFKLTISFIQMLVNPDKMNEKEQGVGGLLKRVIISLALIFLVPSIFDLARVVQKEVIPVIPKVILGVSFDVTGDNAAEEISDLSRIMAFYSFVPFFNYQNETCNDGTILGTGNDDNAEIFSVSTAASKVNEENVCSTDENGYKYLYLWPFSLLVGAYLVYVLVSVAVAIAIRAIKFSVCEILAPIPIASYIDPKTSQQSFEKWVNITFKTYTDLFIRLIIVYFFIFLFQSLFGSDTSIMDQLLKNVNGSIFRRSLIILFLIVGLLQFVKQAPKFLSDLLGLQGTGDFMGMFKGEGWKAIGNTAGGLAGTAYNTASAGLSSYNYSKLKGEKGLRRVGRGLRGAASTFGRSTISTINGNGWRGTSEAKGKVMSGTIRRTNTSYNKRVAKDNYRRNVADYETNKSTYSSDMESYNTQLSDLRDERNTLNEYLNSNKDNYGTWNESLSNLTDTPHDNVLRRDLEDKIANYENYNNRLSMVNENIESITKEKNARQKRYEEARKPSRPASYGIGSIGAAVKNFAGTPIPTSSTYQKAAALMNDGKNKIFASAKSKVMEKPAIVNSIGGINFKDDSGNTYGSGSFETIFNAYKDLTEGRKSEIKIGGKTVDRSQIESIFGNALKDAAAYYIDGVENGTISNVNMKNSIDRWQKEYENDTVIDSGDRQMIDSKLKNGHGNFFKSSDDIGAIFENVAYDMKQGERSDN